MHNTSATHETDAERLHREMTAQDWEAAAHTVPRLLGAATGLDAVHLHYCAANIARNMHARDDAVREFRAALAALDATGLEIQEPQCADWLLFLDRLGELDIKEEFIARCSPLLADAAWLQIAARRSAAAENTRRELPGHARQIFALGHNCLCDDLALRWGYASLTVEGPFSAAQFHGDGPAFALQSNFALFDDPASVKVYKTPSGFECPYIPGYGAVYGHETGPYWVSNGLAHFFSLYQQRIKRFRYALARVADPLFVFVRETPIDIELLIKGIETVVSSDGWDLLLVGVNDAVPAVTSSDPRVHVFHTALPSREYQTQWHLPPMYNSEAGIAFERNLTQTILDAARRQAWAT